MKIRLPHSLPHTLFGVQFDGRLRNITRGGHDAVRDRMTLGNPSPPIAKTEGRVEGPVKLSYCESLGKVAAVPSLPRRRPEEDLSGCNMRGASSYVAQRLQTSGMRLIRCQ
jgi:hypothetical protein